MRKIPTKLRDEMAADPYYKLCAMAHVASGYGRIEWHHHIIHAGKQLNEKWAIVPLRASIHAKVTPISHNGLRNGLLGELDRIVLNRATDEELQVVSKSIDYIDLRDRLNKKYG